MNSFIRVALLLVAASMFGVGAHLGYRNLVGPQIACFGAGGLVLVFVFLSQFKRFKGPFGIEGEMWEREMEEAQEIAERFRNLATVVAKPLISNSVRMGRWSSGLTRHEIDEMVRDVKIILEKSGSSRQEIEAVLEDHRRFTAFDMARPAYNAVKDSLDAKIKERRAVLDAFRGKIAADQHEAHRKAVENWRAAEQSAKDMLNVFDIANAGSYPEKISACINECALLEKKEKSKLLASIQDILDDLTYLRETGRIRRPNIWFSESKH